MALHFKQWSFFLCLFFFPLNAIPRRVKQIRKQSAVPLIHNQLPKLKFNTIKVLIDQSLHPEWIFSCPAGFDYIVNAKMRSTAQSSITISFRNRQLQLNGMPIKGPVEFRAHHGLIAFKSNKYKGTFSVVIHKNGILLINNIGLEEYIASVLKMESWPGWPIEVNKVFAIACRTYAIYTACNSRKLKAPFDIKNTNFHQTYGGYTSDERIRKAVEQTKGIVLGYQGKPILAMFDSCCGGIIPAHISNFDFSKTPYLARTYACTYCKPCSIYSWKCEYALHELECHLHSVLRGKKISNARISKKDKAGVIQELAIKGSDYQKHISGQQLYSLLKDTKSYCFNLKQHGKKIILDGRGYGHHIGLCQWGAREMVRNHWSYKRILQFYYPQTQFMKLT